VDLEKILFSFDCIFENYPFISNVVTGLVAGVVAGLIGMFCQYLLDIRRRKIYDVQFDRDIKSFSYALKDSIPAGEIQ
jgi:hypothetical protein